MNDTPCSPTSALGILILFSLVKSLSAEHLLSFVNTHFQSFFPAQSLTLRSHAGLDGLLSPSFLVFSYSSPTHIFQRNFESQDMQGSHVLPSNSATSRQPHVGAFVGRWTVGVKVGKAATTQDRKKGISVKTVQAEQSSHSTLQGHFLYLTESIETKWASSSFC